MALKGPFGWIDALRHLLSLAVIFQHMPATNRYPPEINAFIAHWVPAMDGAVACFFLLSGLFAKPEETGGRWKRQAVRLLVPFLLFSIIYGAALVALNKTDAAAALLSIVTGRGVGPQLYFLPYLLLVSTCLGFALSARGKSAAAAIVLVLFAIYLALPTASSTGAEVRLLALYALAYAWGVYRARYATRPEIAALVAAAALGCAIMPWQTRQWDLALIVLVVEAALQLSRRVPWRRRLPGSGGVYLLHTPLLNHTLSILLWQVGVVSLANVFASLLLTYALALGITLALARAFPARRWLLLE